MNRFDNPDVIIGDVIASHGKWRRNKAAIICGDQSLTWAEFNARCNRVANGLIGLGLAKGDKVSLLSGNCLEWLEILFGTIKAGGVIVPLSVMVPGQSLARMVADSDSSFLFASSEMAAVMAPFRSSYPTVPDRGLIAINQAGPGWNSYQEFLARQAETEPVVKLSYEDPINIMYTSGTTGVPKGILHTHHNRTHFALSFGLDFRLDSSAITIVTTALYANGTWLTMLPTIFSGGSLVIMEKFEPQDFFRLTRKHRCSHTFMVPTQFQILMENPDFVEANLNSIKVWLSAGSPFRTKIKKKVIERFPGELMELWGLTEGVATTLKPEHMATKADSVGLPLVGWDLRIIDEAGKELPPEKPGEIVAYSAWLMPEYYQLPDQTAEAVWLDETGRTYLRTGDMGQLDGDGFLYLLDRKKDMIISGGINIFASDVEEVVAKHPEVGDVAVIGIPHSKWGETPLALIVPKSESAISTDEILGWANPRLAKFQRLSAVEFRPSFPRNALGKVLKRELRQPYWAKN